jgi:hypothetical protein
MYEDAYRILDFLPLRKNSPEEARYIDYLWGSFQTLGENENADIKTSGIISFHMLFMLACQYKILRLVNFNKTEYQRLFILKDVREKDILNPTSAFTFSKLSEKDVFRICTLINLPEDKIKKACDLVNERNDLAHANGKIEIDYESKIDTYLEILDAIQSSFVFINNELANNWLSRLDPSDDKSDFKENNLAQEYLCGADFESGLLQKHFNEEP